jgi:hypothetical protein
MENENTRAEVHSCKRLRDRAYEVGNGIFIIPISHGKGMRCTELK